MNQSQLVKSNELNEKLLQTEESIVYWLKYHAQHTPDKVAIRVVNDSGVKETTYGDFVHRIEVLAANLIKCTKKGDRALLLFDNDDSYASAFYACLFAGVIAVPIFPPSSLQSKNMVRLQNIIKDAAPTLCLTTRLVEQMIVQSEYSDLAELCMVVDSVENDESINWVQIDRGLQDIALLQYTSGSTGDPKGVMVSHKNLIANQKAILSNMRDTNKSDDSAISWLPLYHDMGLIGGLIGSLFRGITLTLFSPFLFLQQPKIWLSLITKYKPTLSAAPDFAYKLCIEQIKKEELEDIDLSSIKYLLCGAEPIQYQSLIEFSNKFKGCGFDASVFSPSYGLAEATLLVSGTASEDSVIHRYFDKEMLEKNQAKIVDNHTERGKVIDLVSSGKVAEHHTVMIANQENLTVLEDGQVGEILVFGDSVTEGYWNKPEQTEEMFVTIDDKKWLRTGDLGFLLDSQLYIAGRIKDVIILNGRNVYPQDIEKLLESELEVISKGRSIAFAVNHPETKKEGVGIAVEIPSSLHKFINMQEVIEEIQVSVSEFCQQPANVVLLLEPKSITKTSSGKLQRQACVKAWKAGELNEMSLMSFEFGELKDHSKKKR